jgi:hypothetical protein
MARQTTQILYSPSNYTFEWTSPADGGIWYAFDRELGAKIAKQARAAEKKRLEAEGWTVKLSSLGTQLRRKGGIGSGLPDIEFHEPCYVLDGWKEVR